MVRKFGGGVGLLASILAGVGAAGAADLAVKAPVYKAPPVIVSDWAGFYLGVNGGYGWGSTSFDSVSMFGYDESLFTNTKPKGGLFGGHAGYNWQYGSVVTGVEVDFDGADIKSSDPFAVQYGAVGYQQSVKFDELASARARLGYAVLPNLLAYGTAGLGWGHSEVDVSYPYYYGTTSGHANNFGWVAGAGLEYKVWGDFIARAEYLHYDFAKTTYSSVLFGYYGVNAATTIDVVRAGLSYKF
jgi:opacity protein-like surface antigen